MVAVVSSNPAGGKFFFFLKSLMLILYRNVRFVLKMKNLIGRHNRNSCHGSNICDALLWLTSKVADNMTAKAITENLYLPN